VARKIESHEPPAFSELSIQLMFEGFGAQRVAVDQENGTASAFGVTDSDLPEGRLAKQHFHGHLANERF
jgi:hypothetical protein